MWPYSSPIEIIGTPWSEKDNPLVRQEMKNKENKKSNQGKKKSKGRITTPDKNLWPGIIGTNKIDIIFSGVCIEIFDIDIVLTTFKIKELSNLYETT